MTTSPRLSFEGYTFKKALYRNIDSIKAIVSLVTGANFLIGFDWKTFGISIAGAVITLAVKLLSDAVDYYFKEVEIEK